MAKINSLNDIKEIKVHWSESDYINDVLGCDDNSDIEKEVDVFVFDSIIKHAANMVDDGYDKTSLSVKLKDGLQWCFESKFYLTSDKVDLLGLLNAGE